MSNFGEVDDLQVPKQKETRDEYLAIPPVGVLRVNLEVHPNTICLRGNNLKRMKDDGTRLLLYFFEMPHVRVDSFALDLVIGDHFRFWCKVPLDISALDLLPFATGH